MSIYMPIIHELAAVAPSRTLASQMLGVPLYVAAGVYDDIMGVLESEFSYVKSPDLSSLSEDRLIQDLNRVTTQVQLPAKQFYLESPKGQVIENRDVAFGVFTHPTGETYQVIAYIRNGNVIHALSAAAIISNGSFKVTVIPGKEISTKTGRGKTLPPLTGLAYDESLRQAVRSFMYVAGFCKLLTAKNVEVSHRTYSTAEQKEWRRHTSPKKMPRYRILTINRPTFLTDSHDHDSEGGEHEPEKRRHHVRGHFRTYRHERYRPEQRGTYWIRPHWRGSEALGVIDTPIHVRKAEAAK